MPKGRAYEQTMQYHHKVNRLLSLRFLSTSANTKEIIQIHTLSLNKLLSSRVWILPQMSLHSNYYTRNCKDIKIPRYNLEYVKKGFHYSALTVWNSIPITIRELPTLPQFKKV